MVDWIFKGKKHAYLQHFSYICDEGFAQVTLIDSMDLSDDKGIMQQLEAEVLFNIGDIKEDEEDKIFFPER